MEQFQHILEKFLVYKIIIFFIVIFCYISKKSSMWSSKCDRGVLFISMVLDTMVHTFGSGIASNRFL